MNLPQVNVVKDLVGTSLAMLEQNIFTDPCHQMVFPATFDDLVENVR